MGVDDTALTTALDSLVRAADNPTELCWPFLDMFPISGAAVSHSRRLVHQATGMVLAQLRIAADDARLIIQG